MAVALPGGNRRCWMKHRGRDVDRFQSTSESGVTAGFLAPCPRLSATWRQRAVTNLFTYGDTVINTSKTSP